MYNNDTQGGFHVLDMHVMDGAFYGTLADVYHKHSY